MLSAQHVCLVITTYNRVDSLVLVLLALAEQDIQGFQVVVADDGSAPATRQQVEKLSLPYTLNYVWQADNGFRAGQVRNLALHQIQRDYVIFLDGDTVPQGDFIRRHCQLAEIGYFVAGHRILCQPAFTQKITQQQLPLWQWSMTAWLWAYINRDINHILGFLHLPDGSWRKRKQSWQGAISCNLGIWLADLITVNGFEQQYQGWGHEDADLVVRLLRAGVQRKSGRFATAVLHLWHKENDRRHEAQNKQRLQKVITANHIRAFDGYQENQ